MILGGKARNWGQLWGVLVGLVAVLSTAIFPAGGYANPRSIGTLVTAMGERIAEVSQTIGRRVAKSELLQVVVDRAALDKILLARYFDVTRVAQESEALGLALGRVPEFRPGALTDDLLRLRHQQLQNRYWELRELDDALVRAEEAMKYRGVSEKKRKFDQLSPTDKLKVELVLKETKIFEKAESILARMKKGEWVEGAAPRNLVDELAANGIKVKGDVVEWKRDTKVAFTREQMNRIATEVIARPTPALEAQAFEVLSQATGKSVQAIQESFAKWQMGPGQMLRRVMAVKKTKAERLEALWSKDFWLSHGSLSTWRERIAWVRDSERMMRADWQMVTPDFTARAVTMLTLETAVTIACEIEARGEKWRDEIDLITMDVVIFAIAELVLIFTTSKSFSGTVREGIANGGHLDTSLLSNTTRLSMGARDFLSSAPILLRTGLLSSVAGVTLVSIARDKEIEPEFMAMQAFVVGSFMMVWSNLRYMVLQRILTGIKTGKSEMLTSIASLEVPGTSTKWLQRVFSFEAAGLSSGLIFGNLLVGNFTFLMYQKPMLELIGKGKEITDPHAE